MQLVDDVLYTDAAQTDTGADRVDAILLGKDGNLAAGPSLARYVYYFYGAAVDLGNLHLEQPPEELLVGARDDKLRPLVRLPDGLEQDLHLLAHPVPLVHGLLGVGQDRFGPTHLDGDLPRLDLLDGDGEDLALLVGKFLEDEVPFRFPQSLHDDLFGRLGGDAPRAVGQALRSDDIVNLSVALDIPGVAEGQLELGLLHLFHHGLHDEDAHVSAARVELDGYVLASRDAVSLVG